MTSGDGGCLKSLARGRRPTESSWPAADGTKSSWCRPVAHRMPSLRTPPDSLRTSRVSPSPASALRILTSRITPTPRSLLRRPPTLAALNSPLLDRHTVPRKLVVGREARGVRRLGRLARDKLLDGVDAGRKHRSTGFRVTYRLPLGSRVYMRCMAGVLVQVLRVVFGLSLLEVVAQEVQCGSV